MWSGTSSSFQRYVIGYLFLFSAICDRVPLPLFSDMWSGTSSWWRCRAASWSCQSTVPVQSKRIRVSRRRPSRTWPPTQPQFGSVSGLGHFWVWVSFQFLFGHPPLGAGAGTSLCVLTCGVIADTLSIKKFTFHYCAFIIFYKSMPRQIKTDKNKQIRSNYFLRKIFSSSR
jgi:hypothetical protein